MSRPSPEQRKALGAFLASKRARIQPVELGLPGGPRRTPGLRREEVAVLSGVSVSWYTWIEQGRDIQASVETLRRVAKVLRLDNVEANHLFALSMRTPLAFANTPQLSEGLHLLLQSMDPIPAYVRNARFDILAWNSAVKGLFVDYDSLRPSQRNTVSLLFLHAPYRSMIVNWVDLARRYVSALRAARTRATDKAPFDALAAELSGESDEFRAWWSEVDVGAFDEGVKRLRHPTLGTVEYTYVALAPEGQPELSVVTYLLRGPDRESGS